MIKKKKRKEKTIRSDKGPTYLFRVEKIMNYGNKDINNKIIIDCLQTISNPTLLPPSYAWPKNLEKAWTDFPINITLKSKYSKIDSCRFLVRL